jgi:hypothetical protein
VRRAGKTRSQREQRQDEAHAEFQQEIDRRRRK